VPCAPVLSRAEVLTHEQILANDLLAEYDHPQAGRIRQPRPAAKFGGTPADIRGPAPALGADTATLLDELGFDQRQVALLMGGQEV